LKHLDSLVFQVAVGHGLGLGLVHFGPSLGLSLHDIDLVNISAVSLYFTAPLQHLNILWYCAVLLHVCLCFTGTVVRLCDFHKEQAWLRWINNSRNGVDSADKEQLLAMLQSISHADSAASYAAAVELLKRSSAWKSNKGLQNWFTRRWLPHHKVNIRSLQYLFIL